MLNMCELLLMCGIVCQELVRFHSPDLDIACLQLRMFNEGEFVTADKDHRKRPFA